MDSEEKNQPLEAEVVKEIAQVEALSLDFSGISLPEKITTNKEHVAASDAIALLKKKLDYAEDVRKRLVAPAVERQKKINLIFKTFLAPVDEQIEKAKVKMLAYDQAKRKEQEEYERNKMQEEGNQYSENIVVDDKVAKIRQGEESSNFLKTTIRYRVRDPKLQDIVHIKMSLLKTFLENGNSLPDWIETYEEKQIIIRSK